MIAAQAPEAEVIHDDHATLSTAMGPGGYQPLSGNERWNLYLRNAFWSPGVFFRAAGPALGAQLNNEPPAWGHVKTILPHRGVLTLAMLFAAIGPATLNAQYFGQNKVRYRAFEFKVLKTEHFDTHYYDEIGDAAVKFGQMAERWNARLEKLLDDKLSSRQPVVIYGSHPDFRGTTVIPDYIGETTGGVTGRFAPPTTPARRLTERRWGRMRGRGPISTRS